MNIHISLRDYEDDDCYDNGYYDVNNDSNIWIMMMMMMMMLSPVPAVCEQIQLRHMAYSLMLSKG